MLAGVPTVVIGVFIFGLLVVGQRTEWFAGPGLSIVMVPVIARVSTEEVLAWCRSDVREGGMALGASRTRNLSSR